MRLASLYPPTVREPPMMNLNQVSRLRRAVDPAAEIAEFDPLTGVAARSLFVRRLERQWEWSCEQQQPLSLLLINIDHFQDYCARASQQQVDDALSQMAICIAQRCKRRSDFVGRVRTDEFAVILADVKMPGVETMAERLQQGLHALAIDDQDGAQLQVSMGAVVGIPQANRFAHSVSIAADHALQSAKAMGSGRIEVRPLD